MMKKRKTIITLFTSICALMVASISFSVAWFAATDKYSFEKDHEMDGSVLESYFDKSANPTSGAAYGSEGNPFVITVPRHYENLIKLYTMDVYVNGSYVPFSKQNYYFEIGKEFSTGVYSVYAYDDLGRPTGGYSKTLNLKALGSLEPLGNIQHPFCNTIKGHNITIEKFTVTPKANTKQKYGDVGIFGFVDGAARVSDLYWDNYTVDTSGAQINGHPTGEVVQHAENVRVGHLAGHIKTYESFTNCYVNNCTLLSDGQGALQQDDYGYFGMVEVDKAGSATAGGKNYSYSMDASAWYTYFNTYKSAAANSQMILRNTVEGKDEPGGIIQPLNEKFSDCVIDGDIISSYWVNGDYVDTSTHQSGARNYSLSTMGYVSGTMVPVTHNDSIAYSKDGSNYSDMPITAEASNYTYDQNPKTGDFYNFNSGTSGWEYYHSDNHVATGSENMKVKFTFGAYEQDVDNGTSTAASSISLSIALYLDDGGIYKTFTGSGKAGGDWWTRTIKWSCSGGTITIPAGSHTFALVAHSKYKIRWGTYDRYYPLISGTYSSSGVTMTAMSTDFTYNSSTGVITIPNINYELAMGGLLTSYWSSQPSAVDAKAYTPLSKDAIVHGVNGFKASLYHYYQSAYHEMKNNGTSTYNDAWLYLDDGKWKARLTVVEVDPTTSKNYFCGDDADVVKSGWNSKNIDAVGGGIGFYYRFGLNYMRLTCERDIAAFDALQASECNGTTRFFAPSRLQQCVVCYVKNVGSAIDGNNDNLGEMTFTFVQSDTISTCHPCFMKGSKEEIDVASCNGGIKPKQETTFTQSYHVNFDEWTVQKAAFACLDKGGNFLGRYQWDADTKKAPVYGTGMTKENAKKIDTYVLCVGAYSNSTVANWDAWITNIDFDFKAAEGAGGTFGSVGYRSYDENDVAGSRVEETIINYHLKPGSASFQFMVLVSYAASTKRYDITVQVSEAIYIDFYNYYSDTYSLYVNGTKVEGAMASIQITSIGSYPFPQTS